jgi:hypothetical protein
VNILDAMLSAHGGGAVQQLGRQFGLDDSQVNSAISALAPALAAGFTRNMSSPQGVDGLLSALGGGQHQRYIDDVSSLTGAETTQDGNGILGHVLGSRGISRQVASQASAQTGIGAEVLKQMLPVVAAMMIGTMAKRVAQKPGQAASVGGSDLLGMLSAGSSRGVSG